MLPASRWTSEFRKLRAPAPMRDFPDYDAYWRRRREIGVMHRWEIAAERIPDGSSVLDVGCGSGEFMRYLRERRPHVRVTGADVSEVAVSMVRDEGFPAFRLDLGEQDVPAQFDHVTCFEVLEHIPEAEQAVKRLIAAARRSLIVSVPNVGYIGCRVRLGLFGRFPLTNCIYHVKEHVRHWTPTDFRDWTTRLGLRVTSQAGQYGVPGLWQRWPSLFASGMVYVVEPRQTGS